MRRVMQCVWCVRCVRFVVSCVGVMCMMCLTGAVMRRVIGFGLFRVCGVM